MQAKITYTAEIENIPEEVNKLLLPEINNLRKILTDKRFKVTKDTIDVATAMLDTLRKSLLLVDTRAAECYSILQGYKQAQSESYSDQEATNGALPE